MKVVNAVLYRFTLPLMQPFRAGKISIQERSGLLLQIENEQGRYGLGEIMPLPGWHTETLEQCEIELRKLIWSAKGFSIPDHLEELSGGFAQWYTQLNRDSFAPSVRYGFEAALLHLLANTQNSSIAQLISDSPCQSVAVNALLGGTAEEITQKINSSLAAGYRAFKLKVGRQTINEDMQIVQSVRKQIGSLKLRLDANRSWTLDDATHFLQAVKDCHIEYIEEPLQNNNELSKLATQVPHARIALDESLNTMQPEQLEAPDGIVAVILKPPMFGVETTMRFARRAQSLGMIAVISSPFESGVGLAMSTALAASIGDTPAGLESYSWLADDLLQPRIPITNGSIRLESCHITSERINWSRLVKIA